MSPGAVTGVIGKSGNDYIKFNATKGVILSTGDYQNNQSLVERYCPDVKDFDRKQTNKTGDGILMAMAIGGWVRARGSLPHDARLRFRPHVRRAVPHGKRERRALHE